VPVCQCTDAACRSRSRRSLPLAGCMVRAARTGSLCRDCNLAGDRFSAWHTSDVRPMMTSRRSSTRSQNSRRSRTACAGIRAGMWNGSWQTAGPSSFGGSRRGTGGSSSRGPGGAPNAAPDATKQPLAGFGLPDEERPAVLPNCAGSGGPRGLG